MFRGLLPQSSRGDRGGDPSKASGRAQEAKVNVKTAAPDAVSPVEAPAEASHMALSTLGYELCFLKPNKRPLTMRAASTEPSGERRAYLIRERATEIEWEQARKEAGKQETGMNFSTATRTPTTSPALSPIPGVTRSSPTRQMLSPLRIAPGNFVRKPRAEAQGRSAGLPAKASSQLGITTSAFPPTAMARSFDATVLLPEPELHSPTTVKMTKPRVQIASGLKWLNIGEEKPTTGRKLQHSGLARALQSKTEFTKQEWDGFDIKLDLCVDHFIHSAGFYFRPTDLGVEKSSEVWWEKDSDGNWDAYLPSVWYETDARGNWRYIQPAIERLKEHIVGAKVSHTCTCILHLTPILSKIPSVCIHVLIETCSPVFARKNVRKTKRLQRNALSCIYS